MKNYSFAKFCNSFFVLFGICFGITMCFQAIFTIPFCMISYFIDKDFVKNMLFKNTVSSVDHPMLPALFLYGITTCVCFVFVGVLLLTKKNRMILKHMLSKKFSSISISILIGLLFGGGINFLCALVPILKGEIVLSVSNVFNIPGLIILLVLVFFQATGEEIACRGLVMQRLIYRYKKPWLALLLSSLVFGIMHLLNPGMTILSFLNIVIHGLMYALICYALDNYYIAFAGHCGWNYMQNIVLGLPNSGNAASFSIFELVKNPADISLTYDPTFGVEGTLTALLLGVAIDLILIFICIKTKKKKNIWAEAGLDIETDPLTNLLAKLKANPS